MKKYVHDILFKYFPRLWFVLKFRVENEYQNYIYCRKDLAAYGTTLKKYSTMEKVFSTLVKDKSFLEIGCDTGFFVLQAGKLGASNAIGIDRNTLALAKAEKARIKLGLANVQFRCALVPDLGGTINADVVLFMSAIHYMFSDKCGNHVLFETMNDFIVYLSSLSLQFLVIEFVHQNDAYALQLVAERFLKSGEYSEESFLGALRKFYPAVVDLGTTHYETRKLYLAGKSHGALGVFGK